MDHHRDVWRSDGLTKGYRDGDGGAIVFASAFALLFFLFIIMGGASSVIGMVIDWLDDKGREKLLGLLDASDPRGEVRMAWHMLLCQAAMGVDAVRRSRSSRSRL